jgi:hypothetical protein
LQISVPMVPVPPVTTATLPLMWGLLVDGWYCWFRRLPNLGLEVGEYHACCSGQA